MLAKTDDRNLVRDMGSNALLSTNRSNLIENRRMMEQGRQMSARMKDIDELKTKVNELTKIKDEMHEIKVLLKQITNGAITHGV
tara:strand:+ start:48 stop:299 length:252 start_codon:yes stop_codon:yes gene_type:complete